MTESAEAGPVICLGGCGRILRAKESLAIGYGPICAERHGIQPVSSPHIPAPARTEIHPDQTELPLDDQLPLWSSTWPAHSPTSSSTTSTP